MATLERRKGKDGKTSWRARIRIKGYPTQSETFTQRSDAQKWVSKTEAAILEGRFKALTNHTLAETIGRYIKNVVPNKPKNQKNRLIHLNWWNKKIGHYLLSDITPAVLAECRDEIKQAVTMRKKYRAEATTNRYMAALSHVFTVATNEWQWMEQNPLRKVTRMKEPRGRTRFLSDEERTRLLKACKEHSNPYLYIVVVIALSTGARKMEILGLRWEDVDLYCSVITLHETKNGHRRILPLAGHAYELVKKHFENRSTNTDFLFPSHDGKKPMDINVPWKIALKRAGIKDFVFHDLRHSAASYLAMNGASLNEIADILGHSSVNMSLRYAHLSQAHTSQVVANMNNKIFGNSHI